MLDIKRVDTNTSAIEATLSYDQIVETLGMRVGLEGGLPASAPGTSVVVEWQGLNADGSLGGALVHVVVDHNYVAPPSDATPAASTDPVSPATTAATAPAPVAPAIPLAGLAIPVAPPAS